MADRTPRNPFLFIVGCPRSGTTLLQRMVNAHRQIAVTPETHWIARYFERRLGVSPEGLVTPQLTTLLMNHRRFPELGIERETLKGLTTGAQPQPYADFVGSLFDLYGSRQGKAIVGDKTPKYVREIPTLHALWPSAKFVHIIRDGRDVSLSVLDWERGEKAAGRFTTWDEDRVSTTAFFWEWNVSLGRVSSAQLGPSLYHEVRYESLVKDPGGVCAGLCRFLGVPYDEAMIQFYEGRTRTEPGLDSKTAWLPPKAGLRDWKSQMPMADVELFEAVAGDLLDELGYPRAHPEPSLSLLEHADRIRSQCRQDLEVMQATALRRKEHTQEATIRG
jgi:hypothetical protein